VGGALIEVEEEEEEEKEGVALFFDLDESLIESWTKPAGIGARAGLLGLFVEGPLEGEEEAGEDEEDNV